MYSLLKSVNFVAEFILSKFIDFDTSFRLLLKHIFDIRLFRRLFSSYVF